jgi:hypothetical protein
MGEIHQTATGEGEGFPKTGSYQKGNLHIDSPSIAGLQGWGVWGRSGVKEIPFDVQSMVSLGAVWSPDLVP